VHTPALCWIPGWVTQQRCSQLCASTRYADGVLTDPHVACEVIVCANVFSRAHSITLLCYVLSAWSLILILVAELVASLLCALQEPSGFQLRLLTRLHSSDIVSSAYLPQFKMVAVSDRSGSVSLIDLSKPAVPWWVNCTSAGLNCCARWSVLVLVALPLLCHNVLLDDVSAGNTCCRTSGAHVENLQF
jgi:hypothetical protein